MYALIDCNNFYASCERVFRPDLNGKPIVVLSNNDGCVIARSNEAKDIGIPMGAPAFQFEKMFKEHNVAVYSANFALYGDMSNRVMSLLSEYSQDVEIYSIDEAFLKLTGFEYFNLQEYGEEIRQRVTKGTGIPISVGIAPTKALAKVANRIAKKYPQKTNGSYLIDTDEKRIKALKWLKVEDVWGIGRRLSKKLNAINVHNAYEFTLLQDNWIKKNMSVVGLRLKKDLEGIPTLELDEFKAKKSIACTRTFEKHYTQLSELQERISTFSVSCSEKLRKQKSCCSTISVFIETNGHRQDLAQYNNNIVIKLPFPTNSAIELSKFANLALSKIFKQGYKYKAAGITVMNFTPEDSLQIGLFDNSNPKHVRLMGAMDKINSKIGQQKIKLASQDLRRTWKMKQERLSPRYTTQLSDIILVKVY